MKAFDWFGTGPYLAGSPPALVLAIQLYKSVMTVVNPGFWFLALLVAGAGVVGMMTVEISTYKMLARAVADQEKKAAVLAGLGAFAVTGMIIFSVYSGADTKSLLSSTAIMLIGYLALMVREYLERSKLNVQTATAQAIQVKAEETQNEIEKLRALAEVEKQRAAQAEAEAKAARARAREAKAQSSGVSGGQSQPSGRTVGQQAKLDPDVLQKVIEYLKQQREQGIDPANVSVRDIAAAKVGIGKSQAGTYKAEALKHL